MQTAVFRYFARNAALGVLWFIGLFTWDALDSWWSLNRATNRIQSDTSTIEALTGAAIDFVLGAAGAYLTMGLMAAVMLHLLLSILFEQ